MIGLNVGVVLGFHCFHFGKGDIDCTKQMVSDMLAVAKGSKPLAALPKVRERPLHSRTRGRIVDDIARHDKRGWSGFETRLSDLASEVGQVLCSLGGLWYGWKENRMVCYRCVVADRLAVVRIISPRRC